MPTVTTIRIGRRYQGPSGTGQGGWTSALFERAVGHPLAISIRAPIPLDTDLDLAETDEGWQLRNGEQVILAATPRTEPFVDTPAVSIEEAAAARARFPAANDAVHPVPDCFSCGPVETSMGVHAGPLADGSGRFAVDWTVPAWAATESLPDDALLWTAMDCTMAWYVAYRDDHRPAFTVSFAAEVTAPLVAGETYALVAWNGDYAAAWDGRKRGGAAAAFDSRGTCVARSRSFWVAAADNDPRVTR